MLSNNTPVLKSPNLVAKELDISAATLRRWSDEFTNYLSIGAGAAKGRSHRRYTNNDVEILCVIKDLMNKGMTYEQVRQQLNGHNVDQLAEPEIIEPSINDNETEFINFDRALAGPEKNDERALITSGDSSPAIAFLTNTLAALSDSQKSILNSQAANRELLGVLLQDNFNLKEENSRLRDRILEVERNIAQSRQEEEWRREALRQELEAKISASNQLATEAIAMARSIDAPQIKAIENRPGCLGMLLGRGGTQIITTPQRRKNVEGVAGRSQQTSLDGSASYPGVQQPAQGHHPKPLFPPE